MSFDEVGQLRLELDKLHLCLHKNLESESAAVESMEKERKTKSKA